MSSASSQCASSMYRPARTDLIDTIGSDPATVRYFKTLYLDSIANFICATLRVRIIIGTDSYILVPWLTFASHAYKFMQALPER